MAQLPYYVSETLEKRLNDEISSLTRRRATEPDTHPQNTPDISTFHDETLDKVRETGMSIIFKLVVEALLQPELETPTNVISLMSLGDLAEWLKDEARWHWSRELARKKDQHKAVKKMKKQRRKALLQDQVTRGFILPDVQAAVEKEEAEEKAAEAAKAAEDKAKAAKPSRPLPTSRNPNPRFHVPDTPSKPPAVPPGVFWPIPDEDPPPPELHPCIRRFRTCHWGADCNFSRYPADACLSCLRNHCEKHDPPQEAEEWPETLRKLRTERNSIRKKRNERLVQVRPRSISPDRPYPICETYHNIKFQSVYKTKIEIVLQRLAKISCCPVSLHEIDLGDRTSFVIADVNKPALYAIYNMLLREIGETDLFTVPTDIGSVTPPSKTLDVLDNVNKIMYLSRPEIAQVEKEIKDILDSQSYMSKTKKDDYWAVWKAFNYRPYSSTEQIRRFHHQGLTPFEEFCPRGTVEDCKRDNVLKSECEKLHFRRFIFEHTDIESGDCSYLDTCRRMAKCKFVHYELLPSAEMRRKHEDAKKALAAKPPDKRPQQQGEITTAVWTQGEVGLGLPTKHWQDDFTGPNKEMKVLPSGMKICSWNPAQWIKCDIRTLDMSILGKFDVIMADPPWDIHMELPYGTMTDDEMRNMNIGCLADDGLIFLWVTGRAMELGRECLHIWGYTIVEEIVWVKINQLQRIIRTGRTGHWLNHSKEHCLVGMKGNPKINRGIDCDVIACEVRETSRKPDEIYGMIERICPDGRKLEIFARNHNIHAGWLCLGNQLPGVQILEPQLLENYNKWVQKEMAKSKQTAEQKADDNATQPPAPKKQKSAPHF
eukprot:TRINITY_DN59719_c0_g1_i1.p1 TRINITY_DN59719_c0_g1~~TRINITY_DN59719_c0_g1_i1.p1  ORF type:complete len:825 (-),score=62.86 TRINITY_DN59719_c0_g1_i1:1614-4088(-)